MEIQYLEAGDLALFDGLKFRRDKRTGYFLCSKVRKRLHRYVFEYYNGEIPRGMHIHHVDGDKNNNELSNLACMSGFDHLSHHGIERKEKEYEKIIENLRVNARPKASLWHKSTEGREWHSRHGKAVAAAIPPKLFTCNQCGEEYWARDTGRNRFCSNRCQSAYRRAHKIDFEERSCAWCGNTYFCNKYSKSKTCSTSCADYLWHKQKRGMNE